MTNETEMHRFRFNKSNLTEPIELSVNKFTEYIKLRFGINNKLLDYFQI